MHDSALTACDASCGLTTRTRALGDTANFSQVWLGDASVGSVHASTASAQWLGDASGNWLGYASRQLGSKYKNLIFFHFENFSKGILATI